MAGRRGLFSAWNRVSVADGGHVPDARGGWVAELHAIRWSCRANAEPCP